MPHMNISHVHPYIMPCDLWNVYTRTRWNLLQLGVEYVDLYLIHNPRLAVPDIPTVWAQMEQVYEDGLAK